MDTIDIAGMSRIQRLQAMEAIWDSLIREAADIESPEWHQDILSARKKLIAEGKAEFISLEELKSRCQR